jgi:hypothetical protein
LLRSCTGRIIAKGRSVLRGSRDGFRSLRPGIGRWENSRDIEKGPFTFDARLAISGPAKYDNEISRDYIEYCLGPGLYIRKSDNNIVHEAAPNSPISV